MDAITFGNPLGFLGLLAAALPLYAHFSKQIRPVRIVFSDIRLLKSVWAAQEKKSEPRQKRLLYVRLALIFLGSLAWSQPRWGDVPQNAPIRWYLDASASMSLPYSIDKTRMNEAVRRMKEILSGMPADRTVEIRSEFFPLGSSTRTAAEWIQELDSIRPTAESDRAHILAADCERLFTDSEGWKNAEEAQARTVSVAAPQPRGIALDTAWIEPHATGNNRWVGYARFYSLGGSVLPQNAEWWSGENRLQWSRIQIKETGITEIKSEWTLTNRPAEGTGVHLKWSPGGIRTFWIAPQRIKNIAYIGWDRASESEGFWAPEPFKRKVSRNLQPEDVNPEKTALVVVRRWDALTEEEKKSLRNASHRGISVLGCERGTPAPSSMYDQMDPELPFYTGMVARMPAKLQELILNQGPLPDSLTGANYHRLLFHNERTALVQNRTASLFWLSSSWGLEAGSEWLTSPYSFAWIKRMAEWNDRLQSHAKGVQSFVNEAPTDVYWKQGLKQWSPSSSSSIALFPGVWMRQNPSEASFSAVALHPDRKEVGANRPQPLFFAEDTTVSNSFENNPSESPWSTILWTVLAATVGLSELFFARKSVPLRS